MAAPEHESTRTVIPRRRVEPVPAEAGLSPRPIPVLIRLPDVSAFDSTWVGEDGIRRETAPRPPAAQHAEIRRKARDIVAQAAAPHWQGRLIAGAVVTGIVAAVYCFSPGSVKQSPTDVVQWEAVAEVPPAETTSAEPTLVDQPSQLSQAELAEYRQFPSDGLSGAPSEPSGEPNVLAAPAFIARDARLADARLADAGAGQTAASRTDRTTLLPPAGLAEPYSIGDAGPAAATQPNAVEPNGWPTTLSPVAAPPADEPRGWPTGLPNDAGAHQPGSSQQPRYRTGLRDAATAATNEGAGQLQHGLLDGTIAIPSTTSYR